LITKWTNGKMGMEKKDIAGLFMNSQGPPPPEMLPKALDQPII
jgi:hypothetical protein